MRLVWCAMGHGRLSESSEIQETVSSEIQVTESSEIQKTDSSEIKQTVSSEIKGQRPVGYRRKSQVR